MTKQWNLRSEISVDMALSLDLAICCGFEGMMQFMPAS